MPDVEHYMNELDTVRVRRARELSEIKFRFSGSGYDAFGLNSKAAVVLAYAHWEGFYNDCVSIYLQFLKEKDVRIQDVNWSMLSGALSSALDGLRDRNHTSAARCDFVEALSGLIERNFDKFDEKVISARSNLNFDKLQENFRVLNFNLLPFQRFRNKINKEVVGWRHSVAHGDAPDLSEMSISDHVDLTASLLLAMSDHFQDAIAAQA